MRGRICQRLRRFYYSASSITRAILGPSDVPLGHDRSGYLLYADWRPRKTNALRYTGKPSVMKKNGKPYDREIRSTL
jgi:hypothetical protein